MISKAEFLLAVGQALQNEYEQILLAAGDSHAAATDPGSKAESKYDTRNLEASYLTAGLSRRAEELAENIARFKNFTAPDFEITDPIGSGAIVELSTDAGLSNWYFLSPVAGGLTIPYADSTNGEITLLSPDSPLYQILLNRQVGEEIEEGFIAELR